MTGTQPPPPRTWRYRFSLSDGTEVDTGEFGGNDLAEQHARELSKARNSAIVVQYHDLVDWVYVTEADERR